MLKVRVIGSENCDKCRQLIRQYKKVGLPVERYDADAPENQKQLDAWKIINMPVVQIVDEKGKKLEQFRWGRVIPETIRRHMKKHEKALKVENVANS